MNKLLKLLNPENSTEQKVKKFVVREAVRAVVFDPDNKIALLDVTRDHYYKLPGGGIEVGEDHLAALKRECLEEIGCQIELIGEVGMVVEYRKFCNLKQISYCYLAKLTGQKGMPHFMPDELEEGFKEQWMPIGQALQFLIDNPGMTIESREYIVPRDMIFLQASNQLIKN